MDMITAFTAVAVFLIVAVGDYVWTHYALAVSNRKALRAANFAVGIVLVGAISTLAYVQNHIMVIPAALGAFVGTYITMRLHRDPEPALSTVDLASELERIMAEMNKISGVSDISRGEPGYGTDKYGWTRTINGWEQRAR